MKKRKFPAETLVRRLEQAYPSIRTCNHGQGLNRETYPELSLSDIADLTGFSKRHVCRFLNNYETLGEEVVDTICCKVLRVHPWEVYGDLWINDQGGDD